MSMLAEPRRKQKWSVDPRNSTWSKDDSKFGQKMLERMGWSKGKGLGRSEQGSTEHIKVTIKNNNHGLGANASHEDNWIAHQDDFNELLAQLNSHHGQTPSSEAPSEEKKGFSLEEKSKTSKKRVHYMKFTKGKDLSSRSETDLNCIFGKRSRLEKHQEQESRSSSASQSEIEENGTPSAVELDTESITKTVTSALTMQEYFAQRMAQLKKNAGYQSAELPADSQAQEELTADCISDATEEPKKRKKKKKNKELVEEVLDEEGSSSIVTKDKENRKKKGSRKRKTENLNDTNDVELNSEHLSSIKIKKSKKSKKEEPINCCDSPESVEIVETKERDCSVIESVAEQVEKKSKKKKRKKQDQD